MNNVEGLSVKIDKTAEISLSWLFFVFLKIGAVSFGGHMALIVIVQKHLVDEKKVLSNEDVMSTVAIASLLPGPLAVNVVSYLGYLLKGWIGAIVSLIAIILPATVLMFLFATLYFKFPDVANFSNSSRFLIIAIACIIFSTGFTLYGKQINKDVPGFVLCLIAILCTLFVRNVFVNFILIGIAGTYGYLISRRSTEQGIRSAEKMVVLKKSTWVILGILLLLEVCFLLGLYVYTSSLYLQIFSVFSGMSLSLFGGGFVIIPYMQGLLVDTLHWINTREFIDAIALGQVTPGPILVSCTFIGYKMGGLFGGILATVAIFFPSALLVVCLARTIRHNNSYLKGALKGIQPVVIGMIIASGIQLLETIKDYSIYTVLFGIVAFCLLYFYKISPLYIIPISIFISVVSYLM